MSLENVIAFGKLVITDETLRGEMQKAVSGLDGPAAAEAAASVAKKHGYECTPTEVEEGYKIALKLEQGGAANDELSELELEAVAGGPGHKTGSGGGTSANDISSGIFGVSLTGGGGKGGGK